MAVRKPRLSNPAVRVLGWLGNASDPIEIEGESYRERPSPYRILFEQ